eukprot:713076-Pyramimonas_sp.AAC.1
MSVMSFIGAPPPCLSVLALSLPPSLPPLPSLPSWVVLPSSPSALRLIPLNHAGDSSTILSSALPMAACLKRGFNRHWDVRGEVGAQVVQARAFIMANRANQGLRNSSHRLKGRRTSCHTMASLHRSLQVAARI